MRCEVEGCDREAVTNRYGFLCLKHYKRFKRTGGNFNRMEEISKNARKREKSKCKYCDREIGETGALGMCNKHYQMFRKHGNALWFDERVRPTSHGYYRTGKKGQAEHRKIYEDYIGRKLTPDEVVHHINGIRTDNRIENLYLYPSKSAHTREHAHLRKLRKIYGKDAIFGFKDGKYFYQQ